MPKLVKTSLPFGLLTTLLLLAAMSLVANCSGCAADGSIDQAKLDQAINDWQQKVDDAAAKLKEIDAVVAKLPLEDAARKTYAEAQTALEDAKTFAQEQLDAAKKAKSDRAAAAAASASSFGNLLSKIPATAPYGGYVALAGTLLYAFLKKKTGDAVPPPPSAPPAP
jgi:hypothetical protein